MCCFIVLTEQPSYHERTASLPHGCCRLRPGLPRKSQKLRLERLRKGSNETNTYGDISALCNPDLCCIGLCRSHSGGRAASDSHNRKPQQRQCKSWTGVPRHLGSPDYGEWQNCLCQRLVGHW